MAGVVFHVLNRAARCLRVFDTPGDFDAFINVLDEAQIRTDLPLLAYCVMPNHLHCVIDTGRFHGQESYAQKALSTVKRRTAHGANAILKRAGVFWEHDHLEYPVHTTDCFSRILWDVLADPVRADLCSAWHEWPWSYCRPGLVVSSGIVATDGYA